MLYGPLATSSAAVVASPASDTVDKTFRACHWTLLTGTRLCLLLMEAWNPAVHPYRGSDIAEGERSM